MIHTLTGNKQVLQAIAKLILEDEEREALEESGLSKIIVETMETDRDLLAFLMTAVSINSKYSSIIIHECVIEKGEVKIAYQMELK
jgi:spore maturation protein CgeB